MPEHVLVTGGAGFIGSWLISELNAHGYTTSQVDHHDNHSVTGMSFVGDLLAPRFFDEVVESVQPDRVVHLAAQVGRLFGEDNSRHTIRSNVEMTTIIARECGNREIPLAFTSTSEVYGDRGNLVCDETLPLDHLPHNLYGLSKKWCEEACWLYAPNNLIIWRPSMPYGPGAPPGRGRRALDNFLWQASHGMEIPVHRGSERSWCWVGDTVNAMRMTLDAVPGVYNIGRDDDARPMREIAEMAVRIAGASLEQIKDIDPPAQQTVVKRLGTDRIRTLGWRPTVELTEGMYAVYDWVQQFDSQGNLTAA